MRFQVPQFVDIEDKIIGPLTLKQFFIYLAAVLILIPVYLRSDLSLFLTIAIPVMGTAALFAHFRFHGKSLFFLLMNMVLFYGHGSLFIWRRTAEEKPLKVGKEIFEDEYFLESQEDKVSALAAKAKLIETEGNVVQQDEEDAVGEGETE